ncbi:IS3 family transposase [Bacillus atrophaeus]|uniref:IS3 family transposase n=1 Tax=Bacillus atrophaeus TaxID=1452 RepID=UPI003990A7BA
MRHRFRHGLDGIRLGIPIDINRTTTAIVERTVKEYIHYYNNIRIQTKLNNQSPINYRQLAV